MDPWQQLERELRDRIGSLPEDRIVFVGVGSRLRGDDAIGPLAAERLEGQVPHAIDAGPAPENVTGAIKKLRPQAIIFIDALIFRDMPPGAAAIVEISDVRHLEATTHTISLDVVMQYLKDETGADVFLIGMQPGRIADGEGLTPGMDEAVDRLVATILTALGK